MDSSGKPTAKWNVMEFCEDLKRIARPEALRRGTLKSMKSFCVWINMYYNIEDFFAGFSSENLR